MLNHALLPHIVLCESDHRSLLVTAMAGAGAPGDDLFGELDRAEVVPETRLPRNVVRMGSTVSYRTDNGVTQTVVLVYPKAADIAERRISVMTPVGTALIGLRPGQSIAWITRDGWRRVLTVLSVRQPEPAL